ncbi:MAG: heat-inducible transcription repressor HrcA [Oscillospiraceae bacterium]|nr:heat-inducible transcription repressor HrcA [Oscillospiraceae bacterium]
MDDRKLRILAAVVDAYVTTGEPVGSKAIAALPDIQVSSATIRNDMAVLEQLGLLEQPHTSAGRIPTFQGYKVYIEKCMHGAALSAEERSRLDLMLSGDGELTEDSLIQSATTALAEITQCAAVAVNAMPKFSVISKVEIIPTGKRLYVILLITSGGSIKNKACRLEFDLNEEQLAFFTQFLTEHLHGVSVSDLSPEMFDQLVTAMGTYMVSLGPLVHGLYELSRDMMRQELTVNGTRNLLTCNELDAKDIVEFMEHQDVIMPLLNDTFSGIHVTFSEDAKRENPQQTFVIGNSSMIVGRYEKDGKEAGRLGIIGPMRLNYAKVIPYLEYFTEKISNLISEKEDDDNDGRDP